MKKLLAVLLALTLVASFAACGTKNEAQDAVLTDDVNTQEQIDTELTNDEEQPHVNDNNEDKTQNETQNKTDNKVENKKPVNEANKDNTQTQTQQKPVEKPAEKPVEKPAEKPVETPEQTSLGNILLADFKAKAGSGMGTEDIANALLANPEIKFMGGAMPVEPGLLSGFDNAEITGFKSGYMFAPMIGSIPFIGYIFELENANEASAFISTLQKNANRRWNICVEADETVTGSTGNKVFFVMCPKTLEQ